jgi:hypothetical protein
MLTAVLQQALWRAQAINLAPDSENLLDKQFSEFATPFFGRPASTSSISPSLSARPAGERSTRPIKRRADHPAPPARAKLPREMVDFLHASQRERGRQSYHHLRKQKEDAVQANLLAMSKKV